MRRRLRKKKHLGEFQELGLEVRAGLRAGLSEVELYAFLDRWIDAVEARRLAFGGGGGGRDDKFVGFITRVGRGSVTLHDRQALSDFLSVDIAIIHHEVGSLVDAWHGWKYPQ
jgi:uncharacterized protein YggL (DUF469 family)